MEDVPEEEEEEGGEAGRMVWPRFSGVSEDAGRRKTSLLIRGCKDGGWGETQPCPGSARTEGVGATLQVIATWC